MEIERNLVQMIRTGPPEVLGRFWAGFRRIWIGFRAIYSYAPPAPIYIYIYIYIGCARPFLTGSAGYKIH